MKTTVRNAIYRTVSSNPLITETELLRRLGVYRSCGDNNFSPSTILRDLLDEKVVRRVKVRADRERATYYYYVGKK